jgi:hypothetical protein
LDQKVHVATRAFRESVDSPAQRVKRVMQVHKVCRESRDRRELTERVVAVRVAWDLRVQQAHRDQRAIRASAVSTELLDHRVSRAFREFQEQMVLLDPRETPGLQVQQVRPVHVDFLEMTERRVPWDQRATLDYRAFKACPEPLDLRVTPELPLP